MEPRIQYARTSDGVNIAYRATGSGNGRTLVQVMGPAGGNHVEFEWRIPHVRDWYERLGEGRSVVRFDPRGQGLSDRRVSDYSLEAHVKDLGAVVDSLGLSRVDAFAGPQGTPIAIAYAVRNPDRVARLVLWQGISSPADAATALSPADMRAFVGLLNADWRAFTEFYAHSILGWELESKAGEWAAMIRQATSREAFIEQIAARTTFDVTDMLPELRVPTLVMMRRGIRGPVQATRLANSIGTPGDPGGG